MYTDQLTGHNILCNTMLMLARGYTCTKPQIYFCWAQELKIGLSENSVFNVYHPDAVELFSVCNSLPKVRTNLKIQNFLLNADFAYFTWPIAAEVVSLHWNLLISLCSLRSNRMKWSASNYFLYTNYESHVG